MNQRKMKRWSGWIAGCLFCLLSLLTARGAEDWQAALTAMPLTPAVRELNRSNCVSVMLGSFQSNQWVKAMIFMPGATDEMYMFRRVHAFVTNASPTLLDAVVALTNQSYIRVTFQTPFLLLHTGEDLLDPQRDIANAATGEKVRRAHFPGHVCYNDRDWDSLIYPLQRTYGVFFTPRRHSTDSYHFYRHSFAAWNLTGWEGLEALCFAARTGFVVKHGEVAYTGDNRLGELPKLDHFPLK